MYMLMTYIRKEDACFPSITLFIISTACSTLTVYHCHLKSTLNDEKWVFPGQQSYLIGIHLYTWADASSMLVFNKTNVCKD